MKGYCVDVTGFSEEKKKLVAEAIGFLVGGSVLPTLWGDCKRIGNVTAYGRIYDKVFKGGDDPTCKQKPYYITFDDLMEKAGWCYVEDGVHDYKDLSKTQDEEESNVLFEKLKKENTELLAEIDKLKAMTKDREKALFKSEKGAKFCLISLALLSTILLIL